MVSCVWVSCVWFRCVVGFVFFVGLVWLSVVGLDLVFVFIVGIV